MLPDPIPYSESESLLLQQCFRFLVSFFLDHLLELVRSLAQLREGLLYGIGFLSAFLSGAEIGFFRSVFLETTAMASIVRHVRTPMLLAKVAVFLGKSFPRDSGTLPVPGRYVLFFIAVRRFLVARSDGLVGSFLATYALGCLERQKERTHVHMSPTFLVKVGLILPRSL